MATARTDAELVQALARGDGEALAELYARHAPALLATGVYVLGDTTQAEDVLHEVMLQVWRRAEDYDPARGSVRAWLLVRMSSRALDAVRARARRTAESIDDHPNVAAEEDTEAASSDHDALRERLQSLPPDQRAAVIACYVDGMSTQEAATHLGAPQGTIKSRLRLALKALREHFVGGT